jgi:hypothetical protein
MKKLIFGLIATTVFGSFSYGQNDLTNSRSPRDTSELNSILDYVNSKGNFQSNFNFNAIKIVSKKEDSSLETIVVNDNNFNINNQSNYALCISYPNNTLGSVYFVKTTKIKSSDYNAEYYDLDNNPIFSIDFDYTNENATVSKPTRAGCGQAVANCLADLALHYGWVSVWTCIQSALIPETVAVAAAFCYEKYCH